MEAITLASLIALGMRFVSFLKFIRARDVNSAVTQLAVWIVGIGLTFLAAAADLTRNLQVLGVRLGDVNDASKVLIGLMLLSLGSEAYQFRKAFDNSQTSEEPALVPPAKVVTTAGEAVTPPA